jgi:hypothetical protein
LIEGKDGLSGDNNGKEQMTMLLVFLLTMGDQSEETFVAEKITDEMLATVDCMDGVDMFQRTW